MRLLAVFSRIVPLVPPGGTPNREGTTATRPTRGSASLPPLPDLDCGDIAFTWRAGLGDASSSPPRQGMATPPHLRRLSLRSAHGLPVLLPDPSAVSLQLAVRIALPWR